MIKNIFLLCLLVPNCIFGTLNVAFIGDSITNGYGVKKEEAYPLLVQQILEEKGLKVHIDVRSFNGMKTDSGESIVIDLLTKSKPDIIVIALGINDLGTEVTQQELLANLEKMISKCYSNTKVILGYIDPTYLFPSKVPLLADVYTALDSKYKYCNFSLFLTTDIFQNHTIDRLHPDKEGHKIIATSFAETIFLKIGFPASS